MARDDRLAEYRSKRNFRRTGEPSGSRKGRGQRFYAEFEGEIPPDQHGAGTVVVWDTGTFRNLTERVGGPVPMSQAVANGHLVVWLDGEKLTGAYALTKAKLAGGQQWLLVKKDNEGVDRRRKPRLQRAAFDYRDSLRLSTHRNTDGETYYEQACQHGWEGLIAKRADAPYRGGRSTDWLKFKCVRDQEFVVGGFTDPQGSRAGFGALLVGYHEGGRFRYAGKVDTGYTNATLRSLHDRMTRLSQATSPFADPVRAPAAHWVRPELVVQIGFTEWTTDGRLRHPRYTDLRADKPAAEVVRETRQP